MRSSTEAPIGPFKGWCARADGRNLSAARVQTRDVSKLKTEFGGLRGGCNSQTHNPTHLWTRFNARHGKPAHVSVRGH